MTMKLAVAVNAFLNAIVYLIFLVAVGANFYFNALILGLVGLFVLYLLLAWVLGLLDDMFGNWEKSHKSRV